ncbi:MAG TPA: hypothetical protein VG329_00510 [Candidatus Dormibacteraeota bacterium]|nr:hypothetical protein [Candidatus Dormibacteraeota bacterium]
MGGVAGTLHGSRFTTDDVDVLVRGGKRNLERLGGLLVGLQARDTRRRPLEKVMADLAGGGSARFRTRLGAFDVLTEVPTEGDFSFAALARRASHVEIAGHQMMVAALDDLIAMKEQAHRVKDLARLPELRRIRELLEERARHRTRAKRAN